MHRIYITCSKQTNILWQMMKHLQGQGPMPMSLTVFLVSLLIPHYAETLWTVRRRSWIFNRPRFCSENQLIGPSYILNHILAFSLLDIVATVWWHNFTNCNLALLNMATQAGSGAGVWPSAFNPQCILCVLTWKRRMLTRITNTSEAIKSWLTLSMSLVGICTKVLC